MDAEELKRWTEEIDARIDWARASSLLAVVRGDWERERRELWRIAELQAERDALVPPNTGPDQTFPGQGV